jgi:hypothetical protein
MSELAAGTKVRQVAGEAQKENPAKLKIEMAIMFGAEMYRRQAKKTANAQYLGTPTGFEFLT